MVDTEAQHLPKKNNSFEERFNNLYTSCKDKNFQNALKPIYKRREFFADKFTKSYFNPRK